LLATAQFSAALNRATLQIFSEPANYREDSAKRYQQPTIPDKSDKGLPPEPQLPASILILVANHRVELSVPFGQERAFRSLLRRSPEISCLG